jgi:hypothetical protein
MAWNPAIPATNADLLSAPVRDNFGALDTALMAALATLANGAVLTKAAGPVITGVPAVALGQVLISQGVTTAPIWSASPALTDLKLSGGAIGTSGVGVLALGPGTAPTSSPVDTVQMYTSDMDAQAGSMALSVRDERGGIAQIGTTTAGSRFGLTYSSGANMALIADASVGRLGTFTNHAVHFMANNTVRATLDSSGRFDLTTGAGLYIGASDELQLVAGSVEGQVAIGVASGHTYRWASGGSGSAAQNKFWLYNATVGKTLFRIDAAGGVWFDFWLADGLRQFALGAVDSGGSGYRAIITPNAASG